MKWYILEIKLDLEHKGITKKIGFKEIFAPTAHLEAIMTLFAFASYMNFKLF